MGSQEISLRTIFAPSTSARSLPQATSRGMYFMPQSGAGMRFCGFFLYNTARDVT